MTELILGPIIGGLSPNSAYLWGRADGEATLHGWIGTKNDLSDAQLIVSTEPLTGEAGYAGVVSLNGLTPDTPYHYALTLDDIPPDHSIKSRGSFTTFPPDSKRCSFSFVFGSCFWPREKTPGQIFTQIDKLRAANTKNDVEALRFILMLGDQIYADGSKHNGLKYVAQTVEDYRDVYEHTWSKQPFQKLLKNLPAFMTLDDHEVDNDWTWTDENRTQAQISKLSRLLHPKSEGELDQTRVQNALQAYWEHQNMHVDHDAYIALLDYDRNEKQYKLTPKDQTSYAYTFTYGAAAFFVMDTRTRRIRKENGENSILSDGQWEALKKWLLDVKDKYPVKFLISSGALLYRMWFDCLHDRWSGFPEDRKKLLKMLANNAIEGVYLLVGDLHSAHKISADLIGPEGRLIPLWEFCSSPFEQAPNKPALLRFLYRPLRDDPVKNQKLHNIYTRYNFGLVRVDFTNQENPQVHFEVRGPDGRKPKKWKTIMGG
ncbi:MAG: alkaline phosphatase family protein [Anaerolineales bacterium]|nr:alkaline phosphatase family protein [Anaerolineales bacterium]